MLKLPKYFKGDHYYIFQQKRPYQDTLYLGIDGPTKIKDDAVMFGGLDLRRGHRPEGHIGNGTFEAVDLGNEYEMEGN